VSKAYKELCKIFNVHYTPLTLVFKEMKKFHESSKSDDETVAACYAEVKQLACSCKFGPNLEAFVLNQFNMSLPSAIFERICEEDQQLSLSAALNKALIIGTKMFAKRTEKNVNYINRNNGQPRRQNAWSSEVENFKGTGSQHAVNMKNKGRKELKLTLEAMTEKSSRKHVCRP